MAFTNAQEHIAKGSVGRLDRTSLGKPDREADFIARCGRSE